MITHVENDYLDCREYHSRIGRTSPIHPDFITFHHPDGNHYFAWVHGDQVILRSEAYPTAETMERGLQAVLRNRDLPERYTVEDQQGRHLLLLWGGGEDEPHSGNFAHHSEIGRSCPQASREALHALLLSRGRDFANRVVPLAAGTGFSKAIPVAAAVAAATPALAAINHPPEKPAVRSTPVAETTARVSETRTAAPVPAGAGDDGGAPGWLKWVLPLLAIGALAWGLKHLRKDDETSVAKTTPAVTKEAPVAVEKKPAPPAPAPDLSKREAEPTPTPVPVPTPAPPPKVTPAPGVVVPRPESIKVRLPDGLELDAYKGGIEDKLVKALGNPALSFNPDSETENWYDLDNINFDFDKASITPESQVQIRNLANILKAYPGVKISIGTYADKKGDDQFNLSLSQDRAESVLAALGAQGVRPEQLAGAVGYGESFAKVPESASDEERRADRRTSIRLLTLPAATPSRTKSIKVKLPNGLMLDAYHGGIEDKLVAMLGNPGLRFDPSNETANWFDFDNINFDFDKATITPDSMVQIDNLANILKAFPKVKIRIGGYTDKKGDDNFNLDLSQSRAEAVLAALKQRQVSPSQLEDAVGFGEKFASVPEEASDEARRADRRTSVRVLAR